MIFGAGKGATGKASKEAPATITRHSSGLEQFHSMLHGSEDLSILDMSGASQANITFVTGAGHRISSDDLIGTMQLVFGENFREGQETPEKAQRFLELALTFPDASFDGAMVWDALQFLVSPVLEETVARLLRVVRPGGLILAFFNANNKIGQLPLYSHRIQDAKTIVQVPRGAIQAAHHFNNRDLEKLFEHAASIKFFLTRDNLREVIVRR